VTLQRKRRKPRLAGTACVGGKRCIATHDYNGRRYCSFHLADKLFSEFVREQASGCWAFGERLLCNGALQCCHIMSRRYRAIRWDYPANAVAMCGAHHTYYTHHPLEWEDLCRRQGVEWDLLRARALNDRPMDPDEVIAILRGVE
jgi:hypothetical protein